MTFGAWTLASAGVIGAGVALVHGLLIERLMVSPFQKLAAESPEVSRTVARLISPILQFSAFAWALGGLALVAAAIGLDIPARRPLALFVGALFLFGAVANFWATQGRHPGWILMAIAVALIGASLVSAA